MGSFAVFGNVRIDPKETYTKQVSILGKLHMVIKEDIASGKPTEVKFFPEFPGCMDDTNKVTLVSAHVIVTSITVLDIITNICLVLLLLFAVSLVTKFHFNERKKAKDRCGKWSDTL